jgi:hypothetical protein
LLAHPFFFLLNGSSHPFHVFPPAIPPSPGEARLC